MLVPRKHNAMIIQRTRVRRPLRCATAAEAVDRAPLGGTECRDLSSVVMTNLLRGVVIAQTVVSSGGGACRRLGSAGRVGPSAQGQHDQAAEEQRDGEHDRGGQEAAVA